MQTFACRKFVWRRSSAFLPLVTSLRTGHEICIDMLELLSSVFSTFPKSEINGKVYVSPRANQSPISCILWKLVQYVTASTASRCFQTAIMQRVMLGQSCFTSHCHRWRWEGMQLEHYSAPRRHWSALDLPFGLWTKSWRLTKLPTTRPADRKPWPWIVQSYSYSTVSDLSTSCTSSPGQSFTRPLA